MFCLLCCLGFVLSHAQPYKSMFGSAGTQWNVQVASFSNPQGEPKIHVYEKDTVVKGITYKKVDGWYGYSLFREDLMAGKVWHMLQCDTTEYLYMDYTLQVGDTFQFSMGMIDDTAKIVDSVYSVGGRKYIRCKYNRSPFGQITFIEGVGCIYGITSGYNDICGFPKWDVELLCKYDDGIRSYSPGGDCPPFTIGVTEISPAEQIVLAPNPAYDRLQIRLPEPGFKELHYTVIDIAGRILINCSIKSQQFSLDVSQLTQGVYLLLVETNDRQYRTKFIKQ